jgi:hypothetical protein
MAAFTKAEVDESRAEFLKYFIRKNGGKKVMKYIRPLTLEELPANSIDFYKSKQTGTESAIEYHMFKIISGVNKGTEVMGQWRLTPSTNGKTTLNATIMGEEEMKNI